MTVNINKKVPVELALNWKMHKEFHVKLCVVYSTGVEPAAFRVGV